MGAAGAVGLALHQLGGGNPLAGLAGASLADLWGSSSGRLVTVEAVAFGVAGLAGRWRGAGVLALSVVVLAEAERSHLRAAGQGWGSLTIAVHLAAAAVWLGALVHVLRAAFRWRDTPGQARGLLASYALLALVLYLTVVVVTGTVAAVLVLPSWSALWRTPYGVVLLGKLALVLAVSVLALAARRRLRDPAPVRAGTPIGRLVQGE
ncbi:MAG: CopD family protein [Actinomycetota bacterium]